MQRRTSRSIRKFQCSDGRLARLLVRPEGDSRQRFLHLYPLTEVCYKPNIEHTIPLSANSSALEARSKTAAHLPAPAYEQQEAIFSQAFDLIQNAISERAFPAASVAVTSHGKLIALKAFGRFTYEPSSLSVNTDSIFDLASLTKVVATTTIAMVLYERGLLDLETPVTSRVLVIQVAIWRSVNAEIYASRLGRLGKIQA